MCGEGCFFHPSPEVGVEQVGRRFLRRLHLLQFLRPHLFEQFAGVEDRVRPAVAAVEANLPGGEGERTFFRLGRCLQQMFRPWVSVWASATPGSNPHRAGYQRYDLLPEAYRLLDTAGAATGLHFPRVPVDRFVTVDHLQPLIDTILARLPEGLLTLASPPVGDGGAAVPLPQVAEPAVGVTVPAKTVESSALSVPRLAAGESFAVLSALKERLDPEDTYIGQSLAILRLFRQIEDLNLQSDLPVTLLGPSRSWKTCLAGVINRASSRSDKPFLHLNAIELTGGDPNLFREKWTGYGKKSGVNGRKASDTELGWLQTTAGGTIFVDELHSIDRLTVDYLRTLMGRDETMLRPASGQGEAFVPDVRLLFAPFRDIAVLKDECVLPEDFVRRLGGRYLTVPSLNDRREDIPLFVESRREGRRPDERFQLALLQHDWGALEVDGLLTAIRTAVSRTPEGQPLTVDSREIA